jgi:tetratricopeptide (TPR) repeat protein
VTAPLVSLCLVVKDEAELLPRFLARARGVWDELVAVDTGSTDGTPALLAAAGARVVRRAWDHDFSAPRNAALDLARGAWILYLDPDELVSPELARALRAVAADPGAGAAALRFVNHLPNGAAHEAALVRMFRADPAIRFRHRIHEDPTWAVFPMLERRGLRLARPAGHVDHLGYARERATARGKKERDVGLLLRTLEEDPDDVYAHLKLLEQARFWEDRALWGRAAATAEAALRRCGVGSLAPPQVGLLVALVADGLHEGDAAGALAFLERWAPRVPPSAEYLLRRGELRERAGRLHAAAADFRACVALGPATADGQLAVVRPRLGLARLALAAGDLATAAAEIEAALAVAPRDAEGLLAGAFVARLRGGAGGVEAFARRHRAAHGPTDALEAALAEERRMSMSTTTT